GGRAPGGRVRLAWSGPRGAFRLPPRPERGAPESRRGRWRPCLCGLVARARARRVRSRRGRRAAATWPRPARVGLKRAQLRTVAPAGKKHARLAGLALETARRRPTVPG